MKTIRQLREDHGWTRLQLANSIGVTPGSIYNWERGVSEPRVTQLRELARAFGVSSDDIRLEEPAESKKAA